MYVVKLFTSFSFTNVSVESETQETFDIKNCVTSGKGCRVKVNLDDLALMFS